MTAELRVAMDPQTIIRALCGRPGESLALAVYTTGSALVLSPRGDLTTAQTVRHLGELLRAVQELHTEALARSGMAPLPDEEAVPWTP